MISQDGIIDVAEFCPSPNCDERPNNAEIDLIVIHAISLPVGFYNTQLIKDLFLNCFHRYHNLSYQKLLANRNFCFLV